MTKAPLRIASYNMRKAMGTDRKRDPARILRVIQTLAADIVVLQEADMRLGPRPSALPMDQVTAQTGLIAVPVPSEVSIGWHGNAVLLRPEAELIEVKHLNLPGMEPRGAMVVDFDLRDIPLRIIATELRKRLRKTDFIARFGGEEFALLLPETPAAAGLKLLDNLRTGIENCPFHFKGARIQVTLSGGLASFAASDRAEQVFERADRALYRAKDSGRNRIEAD